MRRLEPQVPAVGDHVLVNDGDRGQWTGTITELGDFMFSHYRVTCDQRGAQFWVPPRKIEKVLR